MTSALPKCFRLLPALLLCLVVSATALLAADDTQTYTSCPLCGMNRGQFAHSRMLVRFEGGGEAGYCSLHCAMADWAVHLDRVPTEFLVGDFLTKQLIRADTATWVLLPETPGVMTRRAKWALSDVEPAKALAAEKNGRIITFDEAMKEAFDDMYQDTRMIQEKRKAKRQAAPQAPGQPTAPAAGGHAHPPAQ